MKKMKCTSCGAELKVEDNKEYAVCEHCGSKYKLNEDLNVNIKIDDNVKEIIDSGLGAAKKFSKLSLIPVGLFFVVFICIIAFAIKSEVDFNERSKKTQDEYQEKADKEKEKADKVKEEAKKMNFNFQFENSSGTKSTFFLKYIFDDIIESNKKNERKVALLFNGESTTDESRIIEIKHGLGDTDEFEVSINYDDDGYVNEIKVDKIG